MMAVVTSLPRFYHQAVNELKKEGVKFLSLKPDEDIPPDVDVVITSASEKVHIVFPTVIAALSAKEAVREALQMKKGLKKGYSSIFLGVDPGKAIGIVAMGEGKILSEEVLRSPEGIVHFIKEVEERFGPDTMIIKVGATGGAYRNIIIAKIQENFNHPVQIIDEDSTTKPKRESRRLGLHKDILAARKIALKTGETLHQRVEIAPAPGEIRNVQKESRKRSGHTTISKELAEAVAKGEIGLDEAIRLQKKGRD
jgi:hypothetical protein